MRFTILPSKENPSSCQRVMFKKDESYLMLTPGFRIRTGIHLIRVRKRIEIRHFKLNTDPDPIRIQGIDDQKLNKIYNWKKVIIF
jgi:hypothetical protein